MLSLGNKLTLTTQPIYKFVNEHSVDFDGVDDRIITDGADTVAQPTTYSFWAKSGTTAENLGVFGHGAQQMGAFHFNFSQGGTNKPLLWLGNSYYVFWNDISQQDDGEWHHWVVYSDPNNLSNCKLYCDGVLQTVNVVVTSGSLMAYTESLTIGSDEQVGGYSFEGKIDEFAVYDRELTQAEITRMYNTYYSPNRVANGNFSQIGNEEVTNGDFSQEGSELVVCGNFECSSPSSDWDVSGLVTIANGVASFVDNGTNTNSHISQGILTANKTYKITFDVTRYVAGNLQFVIGSTSEDLFDITSGVGSYVVYYTVASGGAEDLFRIKRYGGSPNFDFDIDNVSVKEVGQDWTFGNGWTMGDNIVTTIGEGDYFKQTNLSPTGTTALYKVVWTQEITNGTRLRFFARNYNDGSNVTILSGSATGSGNFNSGNCTGSGTYTVFVSTTDGYSFKLLSESGNSATVDNVSVKEVGQHWTFGSAWSTDGTKAIYDDSAINSIAQTLSLFASKTYKIQFKVSNSSGSGARMKFGNAADSVVFFDYAYYTDGEHTLNYNATSNSTDFNIKAHTDGSSFDIDNIVVQELKHDATNLMLNAGAYQSANPLITSTKSIEFDGTDDYLQLSEPFSYTNNTICAWIYRSAINATDEIFSARDSQSDGLDLMARSSGAIRYKVNGNNIDSDNNVTEVNKWAFVTATYDGATAKLYINGVLNASSSISETISTTTNVKIGKVNYSGSNYFDGKITEVGTWDRALTSLEVASLYNQGMPTNLLVNRNNYQSGNPTVFNTEQVDFDGTDDYLQTNKSDFLGTSDFTISGWIKSDTVTNNFILGQFEDNDNRWYIRTNFSDQLHIYAKSGGTEIMNIAGSPALSTGEWYHFAITADRGASTTLYLNGVQINQGTHTSTLTFNNTDNLSIGKYSTSYFDGDMSQIGIWNKVLTTDEVSSLYNHGLPIDLSTDQAAYESSSNLVGYWRMGSGTLDTYPLIADQTNATLGSELVTNGDFSNGSTDWQLFNTTIANGLANFTDNSLTKYIVQYSVFDVGDVFQLTFTVNRTSGTLQVLFGTGGSSIPAVPSITESGTYTFNFKNTTNGEKLFFFSTSAENFVGTIDNVSAKKVQGNPAIMTNQTSSDIENGSPYANIVQNSDFATDSDWTKGTGVTISGGKANWTNTANNVGVNQNGIITSGKTYKISYTVSNYSSGSIRVRYPFISDTITANGTYTATAEATSTDLFMQGETSGDANVNLSIDNVTVEEVNTGLQGYWKMGDGTNDEYPYIFDQTNPTYSSNLVNTIENNTNPFPIFTDNGGGSYTMATTTTSYSGFEQPAPDRFAIEVGEIYKLTFDFVLNSGALDLELFIGDNSVGSSYGNKHTCQVGSNTAFITITTSNSSARLVSQINSVANMTISNIVLKKLNGNIATMTNMVEGNITNQYPLTKIRNYYRMGDGIIDGYPIIQDQTSPNLAHIPTTNLITYSEKIDDSSWTKNASSIVANQITAPDNTISADLLKEDSSNAEHWVRSLNITAVSGTRYSMSFYAKQKERTWVKVNFLNSGVVSYNAWVNLANGEVGTKNANLIVTTSLEENGFYRIKVSANAASTIINLLIGLATGDNVNAYQGDGTSGIYIWGCQVEEQSQATAYIKSDGIAAVRKSSTTNLMPYSEDFNNAAWSKSLFTFTANYATAPDGSQTAYRAVSSGGSYPQFHDTITGLTIGQVYTVSFYVKSDGTTQIQQSAHITSNGGSVNFTPTNEWVRIQYTRTATATSHTFVTFTSSGSAAASSYLVWGYQVEQQTQAETYAKTTGLPVTIDLFTENNYGTMTNMSASDIVEDTP